LLLIKLWNFIRGYVIILVNGYFIERFINICTHRNILLWDIRRMGKNEASMCLSVRGFKRIRPIVRKSSCKVKILKKNGLPFYISSIIKRKWFLVGIILCVLFINIMAAFVWDIKLYDAEGKVFSDAQNEKIIYDTLTQMGIKRGIIKYGIDLKDIAQNLMLNDSDLAWVSARIMGTKLKIEVQLRDLPPDIVPEDVPCDVVAKTDGFIELVLAKNGTAMVKQGETVKKGQLLISGEIRSKDGSEIKYVHALGNIYARTWYEVNEKINSTKVIMQRTGNYYDRNSIRLFKWQIKLFTGNEILYSLYEVEKTNEGSIFGVPIGIEKKRIYEVNEIELAMDVDEAVKIATERAEAELIKLIPENTEIISKHHEIRQKHSGDYLTIMVECKEDIAYQQKMGGE